MEIKYILDELFSSAAAVAIRVYLTSFSSFFIPLQLTHRNCNLVATITFLKRAHTHS